MKHCLQCGAELGERATVCRKCGKRFDDSASTETVDLYDVLVESLESDAAREQCARTLLSLKRAPTMEGALEQLEHLPYVLFSHQSKDEASRYERLLKVSGLPAKLRASVLVCPYCSFAAQMQGKPSERRDGVFYVCYSCNRKFFLSYRDHTSHMLLECMVCGTLLRLPLQARVGRYKCVCGTMLDYLGGGRVAPPPRVARPGRATVQAVHKAATAEPEFVAIAAETASKIPWKEVTAIVLAVIGVFYLGLSLGSIRNVIRGFYTPSGPATVELDPQIKDFNAETTREDIYATLGRPRRESLSPDGKLRNLIYSEHGYYLVLSADSHGHEVYRGTYRLSDEQPLHTALPAKSGP